jgi:hypothetical protein
VSSDEVWEPREVVLFLAQLVERAGDLTKSIGGVIGFAIAARNGARWRLDLDNGEITEVVNQENASLNTLVVASRSSAMRPSSNDWRR